MLTMNWRKYLEALQDLMSFHLPLKLVFRHRAPAEQFEVTLHLQGGADKSLARLISRCRRTESIVSLERGVCSCAELQVFHCYRY